MLKPATIILFLLWPLASLAQDNSLRLAAPQEISQTGFLDYLLPRFGLKYGIRASVAEPSEMPQATLGADGTPVFSGLGTVWHLSHDNSETAVRFETWLQSDVGKRTIDGFTADGDAPFSAQIAVEVVAAPTVFGGDPVKGEQLALAHCGRCHVVSQRNRLNGMGATPSFGMLRTLADWENRFAGFYVRNPHPSFTQVPGITPPFDPMRPSPIFPLEITQVELEAILAFVSGIQPADLGAPIQSQ